MKRIKRIRSHAGHARFLAEMPESDWFIGEIPWQKDIASPYAYSPTHCVMQWQDKRVIIVETSHKCFDVFELPNQMQLIPQNS